MYITQLFADAFVTLCIGAAAGYCAILSGCDSSVAPYVGLAIGVASYACRISTESLMISEELYSTLSDVTITIKRNTKDIEE